MFKSGPAEICGRQPLKNFKGSGQRQPHKMVQHAQTIHRLLPTNCLSVFDHFAGLALKGLRLVPSRDHCSRLSSYKPPTNS